MGEHSTSLKLNSEAWSWGRNDFGQLGDNTVIGKSSPVLVVGSHSFVEIAVSKYYFSFGRKSNGQVWAWGFNGQGQLGDNTRTNKSSPILIVGNHSFIEIAGGYYHAIAKKRNGEVWAWGYNWSGQLGDNTALSASSKSSPVLVVGNHSFIQAVSGNYHSMALKSNGEVWTWGNNTSGELGDNTITAKSSPILIVGNHSFIEIAGSSSFSYARKSNGQVWAWGNNYKGQLGNNTRISKSSPVLVVGNHSFVQIAEGNQHCLARKSNGEVWGWGDNSQGQLGDNTKTSKSSPVLVVGSHSFISIKAGDVHSIALKANGEVWSWGVNWFGQLGDNTVIGKSSPVLVIGNHHFITLGEIQDRIDQKVLLSPGGYFETESWCFGVNTCQLTRDKYQTGIGDVIIKYKNGATQAACEADSWNLYTTPFSCTGWVSIRIEAN